MESRTFINDTAIHLFFCDTFELSDNVRARIINIFSKIKNFLPDQSEETVIKFLSEKPDYELLEKVIGKEKAEEVAISHIFGTAKRENKQNDIQNSDERIRYFVNLHNTPDLDNE